MSGSHEEDPPLDLEAVEDTVASALAIRLMMPERAQIDATTRALVRHLEDMLAQDLGFDEDPDVREMYRAAYVLLDLKYRPTHEATQFGANEYMRELARHTKRLAALYREERGDGEAGP
ncbi:hypothetical protein ACFXKS_04360 [Streptomyces scopuliridis]|uniref:hypothetical protein n=1 Tax=Streptomyces scopuliridis TaxID=452529 RepID=UPI0036BCD906